MAKRVESPRNLYAEFLNVTLPLGTPFFFTWNPLRRSCLSFGFSRKIISLDTRCFPVMDAAEKIVELRSSLEDRHMPQFSFNTDKLRIK